MSQNATAKTPMPITPPKPQMAQPKAMDSATMKTDVTLRMMIVDVLRGAVHGREDIAEGPLFGASSSASADTIR